MKKQSFLKRLLSFTLAAVVFISSTGFVSVQHFCNMSDKEEVVKSCCCEDNYESESADNCVSSSPCCFEKASYLINAVASFDLKTAKTFFYLPIIKFDKHNFPLFSNLRNEKDFSIHDKSPPPISGRVLLLQKSLLLI